MCSECWLWKRLLRFFGEVDVSLRSFAIMTSVCNNFICHVVIGGSLLVASYVLMSTKTPWLAVCNSSQSNCHWLELIWPFVALLGCSLCLLPWATILMLPCVSCSMWSCLVCVFVLCGVLGNLMATFGWIIILSVLISHSVRVCRAGYC